jgi:protein O-GlcNAc transferase
MHYLRKLIDIIIFFNKAFKFKLKNINKIKPNHNLNSNLVISFSAKRERFRFLHLMIHSVFKQTILPNEIILWIEKKDKNYLNKKILFFKKKGLKILFCKNLKSYNKIIHTLKIKKNSYIITLDDDIIYDNRTIEFLVNKSKKNPINIISNRIHKLRLNNNKLPTKYNQWIWNSTDLKKHKLNFQTGVYGVLYPPNSFFKDIKEEKIFTKLSPFADDIWLYWMIRLNNKFIQWSGFEGKNYEIFNFDKNEMRNYNIGKKGNDKQIQNLINYYGFPK